MIEHLAKNYPAAERYARDAIDMLANNPSLLPFALALRARSLHGQGRIVEALAFAQDAHAQLEMLGQVQDGEPTIRLAFAECLVASSDLTTAKKVIEKATWRLRKQASSIAVPEWRKSFLNRIPEHVCILALSRALGLSGPEGEN